MSVVRAFCNPRSKDIKISKNLAFAYIDSKLKDSANLQVGLLGEKRTIRVLTSSVYDPKNIIVKG